MSQPGMRITVDAAMRARDVSPPRPEGEEPPAAQSGSGAAGRPGEPAPRASGPGNTGAAKNTNTARNTRAAKNERRRLGKRGGAARRPSPETGA
ncbi:hypothetical protein [Actinomadura terrae]|uniref:hypothetical protein n=1 Tax=Actinomadura terrae TaxID=604353 RepID=UPI001FA6CB94|nr:hypothetical protein [Actinomadura terrae]